jgi:hypothetical protein
LNIIDNIISHSLIITMLLINVVVGATHKKLFSIIACIALSGPAFFKLPNDVIKWAAVKKIRPEGGVPINVVRGSTVYNILIEINVLKVKLFTLSQKSPCAEKKSSLN